MGKKSAHSKNKYNNRIGYIHNRKPMFRDILKNSCSGKEDLSETTIIAEYPQPINFCTTFIIIHIGCTKIYSVQNKHFFMHLGESKIILLKFLRFPIKMCH